MQAYTSIVLELYVVLRSGFILNLYGSESNSDNPRSELRRIQRS